MRSIQDSIQQQLDLNQSKNLLFEHIQQSMSVAPSFLAALEALLNSDSNQPPEEAHAQFAAFTANEMVKRIYAINPYLRINPADAAALEQIYRQTWQLMQQTRDIKTTLNEFHYPALSKWLTGLYPEEFQKSLRGSPSVGRVTYEEYSAEFQIELLGLDLFSLQPPILDVGCGSQANLVRHLRSLGMEAYGMDREVQTSRPYIFQADWFDYRFEKDRWGTIVSNMGFSNHLNYAYRHDYSQLERYLLKMKEMLEALAVGGCFIYAPALPSVEEALPTQQYLVQREQKTQDLSVSRIFRAE